jgi:hypothetical protein
MPQIALVNSIGQPTGEIQAQTQKPQIIPVRVSSEGGVSHPQEQKEQPKTLAEAVEQKQAPKAPDKRQSQDDERMAAIVRREKQMRQRIREQEEREIKTRQDYEAKEAQYKAQLEEASQAKSIQEGLKTDLIGTLTSAGYTPDQITQALINQPGPESQLIKSLSEKIAKMEKAQADHFKAQQEEASKNYQSALTTIERNVNKLVNGNPEFEATEAYGAQKKVVNYVEKVWKEEGVMLDIEDAVKDVEDYLTEEAAKVARIKKIQAKIAPKPQVKQAQAAPVAQKTPTLTNKMGIHSKPLTARERAIQAFNQNRVRK